MTEDEALEQLTWRYMLWFYDQMQTIYVPSEFYRRQLLDNGFDARKLKVLKRGVDVRRFTPEGRDRDFWPSRGARQKFVFLYVGRVSKEKNLDLLLDSFVRLRERGLEADLALVGGGPYMADLKKRYKRPDVLFTGFLENEELAKAYGSADAFVFPSTTDTFGNAVLEAQASGVPVIVSNQGGPAEIVEHGRSGLIFDTGDPAALATAMMQLYQDASLRSRLSEVGLVSARSSFPRACIASVPGRRPSA
jgi:glycosyltransferase involved in cell wall biosynthesis